MTVYPYSLSRVKFEPPDMRPVKNIRLLEYTISRSFMDEGNFLDCKGLNAIKSA